MNAIDIMGRLNSLLKIDESFTVDEVDGGLFNRVYRVINGDHCNYVKFFFDQAKTNDFPPLPTSPQDRANVAIVCHRLAFNISQEMENIYIPALLDQDCQEAFVYMTAVPGQPLFEMMLNISSMNDTMNAADKVIEWLYNLHKHADNDAYRAIRNSSDPFRSFKLGLQYTNLIESLPTNLHAAARAFILEHENNHNCILHGDINSRNVLVTEDNKISIIDFEQGQVGDPMYDISYIISEFVIKAIHEDSDPEETILTLIRSYSSPEIVSSELSKNEKIHFRIHLAFQVLYRIIGPSCKIWSGHISTARTENIKNWSIQEFRRWL